MQDLVWPREEKLVSGITISNPIILQDFLLACRNVNTMSFLTFMLFKTLNFPKQKCWTRSSLFYLTWECSDDFHRPFPRSAARLGLSQLLGCSLGNETREEFVPGKPRM